MERDQSRSRQRRLLLTGITSLAVLSVGAGMMSMAVFTDDAEVTKEFTTGTIVLSADAVWATLDVSNMMPGDVETAEITVANDGTNELRYAMESSATGDLAAALKLAVKEGGCAGSGASVVSEAALGSAGFGSDAQGADTGDRVLAGGASEVLCFSVSLPLATADTYQATSATATFTFLGEQTANND